MNRAVVAAEPEIPRSARDKLTMGSRGQGPRAFFIGLSRAKRGISGGTDRKSTRLNSSHLVISYAVFCLKKKKTTLELRPPLRAHVTPALLRHSGESLAAAMRGLLSHSCRLPHSIVAPLLPLPSALLAAR